jgi:hypothetical protein
MNGEVVHGPDIDILVPAEIVELRPEGFMLRLGQLDEVVLDMLVSTDGSSEKSVLVRLLFTDQGFQRFVGGLGAVQHDLSYSQPP